MRWALGCVSSCPAARGSQEAIFTQPRAHLIPDPCNIIDMTGCGKMGQQLGFIRPKFRKTLKVSGDVAMEAKATLGEQSKLIFYDVLNS